MISRHRQMLVSTLTASVMLILTRSGFAQFDTPFVTIDIGAPSDMNQSVANELTVTDINAAGAIVGYYPVSTSQNKGFAWYDGAFTTWDLGAAGESTEIWGINDGFEATGWYGQFSVGNRTCMVIDDATDSTSSVDRISAAYGVDVADDGRLIGNNDGVGGAGWLCTGPGCLPQELPDLDPTPYPDGNESFATGVGSAVGANGVVHIVGTGITPDPDAKTRAVVWPVIDGSVTGPEVLLNLDGSQASAANDAAEDEQATVVGFRNLGQGNYKGYIFTPNTAPDQWNSQVITGLDYPLDINNFDEVVGDGPNGPSEPRLYIHGEGTFDLTQLVQTWFPTRQVTAFDVSAINDSGLVAGTGTVGTDEVVCLLVPYDCNNNGTPDYREVLANGEDPMGSGDWLLDDCEMMRPGLQAPGAATQGNEAREIDYVAVVRFITSLGEIDLILCDEAACQAAIDDWDRWGYNVPIGTGPEAYTD